MGSPTTSGPVPLVDLASAHAEVAEEIAAGWAAVIASTDFAGGAAVTAFEESFAAYCGVAGVAGVGNGTDALELALRALGIGRGDEVIVPVNSFIASAEAVDRAGASPVFVDADPTTLLIDPAAVEAAITGRTAAIMPVHLYGQLAPMAALADVARRAQVPLIEDAAQAQGAEREGRRAGSMGAVAATSFYPGKNLGAYGEAGAVLSNDPEVISKVRLLRNHGGETRYLHAVVGCNSRMDSLQAVVLEAKLAHLDRWNANRQAAAKRYEQLLGDFEQVCLPRRPADGHVWHLYVVEVPDRDRVLGALKGAGIGAGVHYPVPIHRQGAYAHLGLPTGSFPVAEATADRVLSLPMHPHLTPSQQERVADELRAALA